MVVEIGTTRVQITGSLLKIARPEAELHEDILDPFFFQLQLKKSGKRLADLFTFMQKLPETKPKFKGIHMEWDNLAAIPVTTYENWWNNQVGGKTRNVVRRLQKKGGRIRVLEFDDTLIKGISRIYNESPIRQGRKFWHYRKPLDIVKAENMTFLDRSIFIGAILEEQLIGFAKLVCEPSYVYMMQILSLMSHRDKSPTNALIAKAVEITAARRIPFLIYSKFVYGNKGEDSLTRFKQQSGFTRIDLPRYYIPLTCRGKTALQLNLHRGIQDYIPHRLLVLLLKLRAKWHI